MPEMPMDVWAPRTNKTPAEWDTYDFGTGDIYPYRRPRGPRTKKFANRRQSGNVRDWRDPVDRRIGQLYARLFDPVGEVKVKADNQHTQAIDSFIDRLQQYQGEPSRRRVLAPSSIKPETAMDMRRYSNGAPVSEWDYELERRLYGLQGLRETSVSAKRQ
jgi:hypothetical protein